VNGLNLLFYPRSVAVIGASEDVRKPGYMFVRSMLDLKFKGEIYPVNPKASEILGLKCYPNVSSIPGEVDLAILLIPVGKVLDVLVDCGRAGVKYVIVLTAGFSETGTKEGVERERKIVEVARRYGMRIVGPNCMGIYCPSSGISLFAGLSNKPGDVAFISQSGSLAAIFSLYLEMGYNVHMSKVVSIGNECDVNSVELLEYFGEDEETRIIGAYIEGVKDGRRFMEAARKVTARKPVVVWKAGRTGEGARAAASHTGSIAGSDAIWNAVFKQTGVVRALNFEELVDYVVTLRSLEELCGGRVAIVSSPGGLAVAATDACVEAGLEIAELKSETKEKIKKIIPEYGTSVRNPVDLGFGAVIPEIPVEVLRVLSDDPGVDVILYVGGAPTADVIRVTEMTAKMIVESGICSKKPLVATMPLGLLPAHLQRRFIEAGIPVYTSPERAARALAKAIKYHEYRRSQK